MTETLTETQHHRTPESLGRAMKADLANYAPLLAVIRDAEKRRQARLGQTQTA